MANIAELYKPIGYIGTSQIWMNLETRGGGIVMSTADLERRAGLSPYGLSLEYSFQFLKDLKDSKGRLVVDNITDRSIMEYRVVSNRFYEPVRATAVWVNVKHQDGFGTAMINCGRAMVDHLAMYRDQTSDDRAFILCAGAEIPADSLKPLVHKIPVAAEVCRFRFELVLGKNLMNMLS